MNTKVTNFLIEKGNDDLSLSSMEKYHEMLIPVMNLMLTIILTKNSQSRLAAKVNLFHLSIREQLNY